MAEGRRTKFAGFSLFGAGVILFGKETILWAWAKALDAFSASGPVARVSLSALPWQNISAGILTMGGLGLLLWPRSKSRAPTRAERLARLQARGWMITDRIRANRKTPWFRRDTGDDLLDVTRDGFALLPHHAAEGLAVPNFSTPSAEKACMGLEHYFSTLGPLMREGHAEQVDAGVESVAERAVAVAAAFNPEHWHVDSLGR